MTLERLAASWRRRWYVAAAAAVLASAVLGAAVGRAAAWSTTATMLAALTLGLAAGLVWWLRRPKVDARVVARSRGGEREIPAGELVTGYYETSLRPDELITEVRVPARIERAVYRKFRSRSHEDRPCVAVAAATVHGVARVVVGAVAERPQYFPELCVGPADEIGGRYAEAIEPISDVRGSADYRRRVIAVEVRRALEELAWTG